MPSPRGLVLALLVALTVLGVAVLALAVALTSPAAAQAWPGAQAAPRPAGGVERRHPFAPDAKLHGSKDLVPRDPALFDVRADRVAPSSCPPGRGR